MEEMVRNASRLPVESLPEPDLSYYLALRAQYEAAKCRALTWEQAVQTFTVELMNRYGLQAEDGIDARGQVHRAPAPPMMSENGAHGASVEAGPWQPALVDP